MGSLFGAPSAPAPDPKLAEAQARQEERLEAQEEQKMRQIDANRRARRVGGQRMLLSSERDTPSTGIQKTLGS
tara:strand:+ start:780 stop:998 length:219 start_codon:yes stop_codon:yes gene_type:complete